MLYKKKEVAKAASENRLVLFYLGLQRLMRQALFFCLSIIVHHSGDKIATIISPKFTKFSLILPFRLNQCMIFLLFW